MFMSVSRWDIGVSRHWRNVVDDKFVTGFDEIQVAEDTGHLEPDLCERSRTNSCDDLSDQRPCRVWAAGG